MRNRHSRTLKCSRVYHCLIKLVSGGVKVAMARVEEEDGGFR